MYLPIIETRHHEQVQKVIARDLLLRKITTMSFLNVWRTLRPKVCVQGAFSFLRLKGRVSDHNGAVKAVHHYSGGLRPLD